MKSVKRSYQILCVAFAIRYIRCDASLPLDTVLFEGEICRTIPKIMAKIAQVLQLEMEIFAMNVFSG